MALVHILVDVLDCLDRSNRLHIDMAPVLPDKIWGVTDHPLVVDLPSPYVMNLASVTTSGAGIRVLSNSSLCSKGLGKTLRATAINHARGTGVLIATGSVNHKLLDQFKEFIIVSGEFRRHRLSISSGVHNLASGLRKTMIWACISKKKLVLFLLIPFLPPK